MKNNFSNYVKKRFNLLFFIPIILVFYLSFYLYLQTNNENITLSSDAIIGFIIVFLIFFHIRILDDIKDCKKDSLKKYLIIAILLEIALSTLLGLDALILYSILLLFSIGIYYDFFIKKILTKNILINNYANQMLIILIGIFIFSISQKDILNLYYRYLLFCVNMFFIFSLFELSRKIKEKEDFKKSYNYLFGKKNFSILVLTTTVAIWFLMIYSFQKINYNIVLVFQSIISLILLSATALYLKNKISEITLKKICFLFLLLTLLIIIFASLYMKTIIFEIGDLVVL